VFLEKETFSTVIKSAPLISIDLVVENTHGDFLFGCRNNRPAKGFWFVPGGRIMKDESMADAFKRLTLNELGVEFKICQAECIGPFEHFYSDNVTGENFSTHYIALGYRLVVDALPNLPKEQHCDYKWLSIEKLLLDSTVHKHSRWYFDKNATDTI
jgi:colanic acid biosynthesis protein WcaH